MWHTPRGDRVLSGAEAALVKASLTGAVEVIREESSGFAPQWHYGLDVFDLLTWTQRMVLFDQIATDLLTETPTVPALHAVNEAAVAVLFEHVCMEIDREIDDPSNHDCFWRQLALQAHRELFPDAAGDAVDSDPDQDAPDDFELPTSSDCRDSDRWRILVESLSDCILWDRDFELHNEFLDTPPDQAADLRTLLGIDADYFAVAAPDAATNASVQSAFRRIKRLTK
ncbi:MAG: hypothetical protein R3C19_06045 [Planctomycetaceae bacterium]